MALTKMNITVEKSLWKAFRIACIERGEKSASQVIVRYMKEQLAQWEKQKRETRNG